MIRCEFSGSRSPLLRGWHLLRCSECRTARSADAITRRGLERLAAEPAPSEGLARTLAAVGVARSARPRKRARWQIALRRPYVPAGALTALATLGAAGWLMYIDLNVKTAIPTPVMPSPNAYDFLLKAAAAIPAVDKSAGATMPIPIPMPSEHNRIDSVLANKQEYQIVRKKHATQLEKDSHADYVRVPIDMDKKYSTAAEKAAHHVYTLAEKDLLVREYGPALTVLRHGFQFPYQAPPVRSFNTPLSYLSDARFFARVFSVEAQVKAAHGDAMGAVQSSLDAMELGAMISHGAVLMASQTGNACDAIGRKPLWAEIDHLNAAQARFALRRLEQIDRSEPPFPATLEEEKWMSVATLQEILHKENWRIQFSTGWGQVQDNPGGDGQDRASDLEKFGKKATVYLALLPYSKQRIVNDFTRLMDHQIAEARKPYTARQIQNDLKDAQPSPDPVLAIYFPFFLQARFRRVAGLETQHALLKTSLAIRAYQLEHPAYPKPFQDRLAKEGVSELKGTHHAYPEHLQDLVPDYLPAVPTDPFTDGKPLQYRLIIMDGSLLGYRLYSVGPDGIDDYGAPIMGKNPSSATNYRVDPDSKGDIVAGTNTN